MSNLIELDLTLSQKTLDLLNRLAAKSGTDSIAEILRRAIVLYAIAHEERAAGREVGVIENGTLTKTFVGI